MRKTLEERFWSKVDVRGPDECWPWRAARYENGYGQFYVGNKHGGAHRMAYYLATGEKPEVVRHTCDNPPCCNPKHLLGGTHADNAHDREERGRGRGNWTSEHNPAARLGKAGWALILKLHDEGLTDQQIANALNCDRSNVSYHIRKAGKR